jgi:hypothetical protein
LKTVQQTITDGINDLNVNKKDEKNTNGTKSSQSTPSKKPVSTAASKQTASKQISIRGIPLVKFINRCFWE